MAITAQLNQPKDDPRFREVEDTMSFTFRFPSGVIANCSSGYSCHESRWLRVMALDAWLGLDPAFGYANIALEIGRRSGKGNGLERIQFAPHNQFARQMDHFAKALKAGGGTVKMAAMQGLDATRGPAPKEEG